MIVDLGDDLGALQRGRRLRTGVHHLRGLQDRLGTVSGELAEMVGLEDPLCRSAGGP